MPRLPPKPVAALAEYDEMFKHLEGIFGFVPNDYLTMGHKPAMMKAVVDLTAAVVFAPGKTPMTLRQLILYLASREAGCMYCVAHTASLSLQHDVPLEKIQNIRVRLLRRLDAFCSPVVLQNPHRRQHWESCSPYRQPLAWV